MRSKFYCRVVIFLLAAQFLNILNVSAQCVSISPTTQPTSFQITNRNQFGFDITFGLDNSADAFLILRSTSPSAVNLSGLQALGDVTPGTSVDHAVVVFASQTRNAYHDPQDINYNYGMRWSSAWTAQTRTVSYIYRESTLTPNTEYYYTILSFNACELSSGGVAPVRDFKYNINNPLTGSTATCLATPNRTQISVSNRSLSSFELTVPKVDGSASYSIYTYSDHGLSNLVSGSPFTTTSFSTATGTISATNLNSNSIYYYAVVANPTNANVCSSTPSHQANSYQFAIPGNLNSQYIDNKVILTCTAPSTIPSDLSVNMSMPVGNVINNLSFTPNGSTGYVIMVSSVNSPPTLTSRPSTNFSYSESINGVWYSVLSFNSNTSLSNISMSGAYNQLYFWVVPYNYCIDQTYKFLNPTLLNSYPVQNTPATPTGLNASSITAGSFNLNWTNVTSSANVKLEVATATDFTTQITGSPFTITAGTSTKSISGLTASTNYYSRISAYNINNSYSSVSSTISSTTLGPPTISSVSYSSNKTYVQNEKIDVYLTTSSNVIPSYTVNSIPYINLVIGNYTRTAYLSTSSGTSTNTLKFTYTVQNGENDNDGISVFPTIQYTNLETIQDVFGNNLNVSLTGVTLPNSSGILVDGTVSNPVVTSITYSSGSEVVGSNYVSEAFIVQFDRAVTGVGSSNFTVTNTGGVLTSSIFSVSGSGNLYTVTIKILNANASGTVRLDLNSNNTTIKDASNRLVVDGFTTGDSYIFNKPTFNYLPTITIPTTSVGVTSLNGTIYGNGNLFNFKGPGVYFTITPNSGTYSPTYYSKYSSITSQVIIEYSLDNATWYEVGVNAVKYSDAYVKITNFNPTDITVFIGPSTSSYSGNVYLRAKTKYQDYLNSSIVKYSDYSSVSSINYSRPKPSISSIVMGPSWNGVPNYKEQIYLNIADVNSQIDLVEISYQKYISATNSYNSSTIITRANNTYTTSNDGNGNRTSYAQSNNDITLTANSIYLFSYRLKYLDGTYSNSTSYQLSTFTSPPSIVATPSSQTLALNIDFSSLLSAIGNNAYVMQADYFYASCNGCQPTSIPRVYSPNANQTTITGLTNGTSYTLGANYTIQADRNTYFTFSTPPTTATPNPAPTITINSISWGSVLNSAESILQGTVSLTTTLVEDNRVASIIINGNTFTSTVNTNSASIIIPTTLLTSLSNGNTYTITANVSNSAGISAQVYSSTFSIDTQAPNIPVINAMITNSVRPTITGNAESNSIISLSINNSTYTTTTSVNGSWSITVSTNLPANNTFTATASSTDAAGNTSLFGSANIIVDTQAPNSPIVNTSITNQNLPNIIGTAEPLSIVTINLSSYTYTSTANSNGDWIISTTNQISDGTYSITSTAKDVAGNISSIRTSILKIDTQLPTINNLTIVSNNINNTKAKNNDIIIISLTASESISTPTVTIAGQSATISGTGGTYTATITVSSPITEGAAAISITYSDLAGNAGTVVTSTTNSSTVTVDVSSPAGYSFAIDQNSVNLANQSATSISLTGAEVGTTYSYSVNGASGTITGTGTITNTSQTIPNINVTSLPDGTLTYSLVLTDASGNVGTAFTQTVSKDSVIPTVSSVTTTATNGNYKAGQIIPIIVTFSEPVSVTGTPQLTVETGTSDAVVSYASGSGTSTLTFNYTVGAGENSVDLNYVSTTALALNSGTINDLGNNPATLTLPALNAAASLGGSANIVIDTQAPSLSSVRISSNNANTAKAKANDVISVSITASESIATPTVTIAGQSATVTGTGGTYTATYTVTSGTPEGAAAISITYSDLAGNAGTAVSSTTNSSTVTVDVSNPAGYNFAINQSSVTQANQSATSISLTSAEVGTTYSYSVTAASGTVTGTGTITNTSQTIPNINVTSLPDGTLTYSLILTDASGNVGTAVTQTVSKDSVVPTVSSVTTTAANGYYKAGQVIPVVVNFSEPVIVTGTPQITLITGVSSATTSVNYTSGSGTTSLTFNYTVGTNASSADLNYALTTSLALNSGTINDLGNNPATLTLPALNAAASLGGSANIVIDTQAPSLSSVRISSSNANTSKTKENDVISVSITASESIATPTVTIAGQSATVTGTGGTYTATYTVTSGTPEGAAAISITYSDLAGNAGTVVTSTTNSSTVTVDVSNPTISSLRISSSNANSALAKVGDVITLSLTASESIATPTVSIAGGTVSMTGSGGTYTATYTVTSSTPQGTASISVSFADISGNAGTTVTSTTNASSVVVDRTAPMMSIVSNPANLRSGQTSTLTFTISESVSDFVASDITISGGSIGTLGGTGTTYTAEFTPTANSNANGVIDVAVNKFTDAAGNANTAASNTVTISIDNTLPTVTITSSTTALKAGETATITFTFSEAVLGFDLSDVTMNNGAFGTLSGTGSSYTATFTPNANVEGTSSISIGATTFTDLAGNDNGVTASLAPLNIDTQVPSIGSSTLSWGASLNNSETGSNGTVTLALTNVENGRTVTVAVNSQTYTATVSSNAATITIPSSRLAALTDGGTYTVTTNVSDAAGNAAPAGTVTFTVDKTLPTITSVTTSAGTVINATEAASAATVTVNTTGTENGQVVSVVLNSQTYSATVSSNVATITIPASALTALTDGGTYTVTTNVSDAAANAANQNSFSISVDKTKPTTTISSSTANLKIGQSATLTITLSEAATDFVAGDITIAGGTIGTLSGTGRNYSATFTPTANYEGTASITLASNQFTDPNGNPNDESSNTANAISIAVDTKAPTMTIASNPANLRSGQSAALTFTISEAVSDFVAGDITISGGSIGTLSGTGTTYTAEFTPTANSNANGVIDVAVNKFTDAAGNANTAASNTVTISIDNTLPTVTITASTTALKAGETATITFTFSEAVLGFDLTDVTVNNGALGTLSGTGSIYTAAFTPNTNVEGTSTISLGANTFTDLAGNNNAVSASLAPLNIDTKVPSIGSSTLSWGTSLNSAETATNGSVTLALTNVENGRTVSVSVNSQTYTATVASNVATVIIPAANLAALSTGGTYTVTTNVSDAAGNAAPAGTSTFTVDKTAPTLSSVIITSDNTPANLAKSGSTITLSITASESIQTPTVSIAGVAATVSGSGTNYTATYPVIATSTSGAAAILISYSDVAGNPGVNRTTTTNSSSVTIDRTAPSMTISSSASTFKIGSTATITFTASEATTNFIQSDVTLTGGTITNWTAVSSTVYTATFTPNANTALNGNLSVAASKFSDAAGNNNVASNNVSFIIDTFRPTVALSSNVNSVNGSQTATINFTFNETVAGFTASDIVVTNGSLGALTGSGSAYSSVFTPAANFNGSATISVASNTFSDTVGNSNTDGAEANNTYTLAVDSGIPALSSVGIQSSNADPTLGNIGDVISINFVSTETVNTPIVTIDGQSAYVSGDGTNWTASYVVINGTNDGPLAFTIDYTDVAGNAGATVSTPTDGSAVSVLKNQTPVDNSTDITLSQDAPDQSINLLAGITDPEGDPLTISNVTITYSIENVVTNQPVVINSTLLTKFQDVVSTSDLTGTNLFIEMSKSKFLSGSQKGQINIAYVVTDGNNSLNANAVLNIIGANDQPTGAAVTLNQVVINGQNMGIPLTEGVGVSTNVPGIDPDDDSVTYTLDQNSTVKNGQFVFNPDGSFSFLPDANYYGEQEFDYYIKDQSGVLNGPYKVKIIIAENPDIDGIPSKLEEVAPNNGDVNGDGIPDRKQNNITNVPLGSYADFQAGIDWANGVPGAQRPATSKIGSLLIGSLPGGKSKLDSLDLDPNAKFRNVALLPTPNIANTDRQFSSDLYQFTIEGLLTNAADTLSPHLPLRDLDPTRPGLQVRAVLEFPVGMRGSTYLKQNKAGEWKSFKDDQNLATYDDGATLIDLDNDPSTIERIVLTFTDGAFGDKDTLVNNSISDPGGLGIIKPVIDDATLPTRAEGVATATALFNVFDRNSRLDVDEEGQKLYYTLDSTNNSAAVRAAVKIDSLTGVISVRDAGGFDFESFVDANGLAQFKVVVKATDTDGNFDLATYTQTITNVDEYPRIISGKTVSYREKQPTTVAVIKVQTLPDYQDLTSFSILSGLDGAFFTIDPVTGVLRFKNSPNYDDKPVYTLDIQSKDLSGKTDHAVFAVNIIDIDADNDGILDDEEIGPDPLHPIDTDKDGIPDYLDTDSDGDGIPDLFESKADTDKDGIPDYLDTDSDGDGILDKIEAGPNPLKPLDSDGDGIPDFRELDADNDGYLDSYEKSIDTDKDGIPDFQDTDSDGDGILDKVEDDLDFGNIKDCDHDGIENRIDPDVCDLILPQIITPNGDGLNDVLKIPGIMRLQPNHITIINRWGAVVYDTENYQNTWGGTGDSGELPDGTYYYVVDFKGAKPTISNFIYLDRTGK